MRIQIVVMAVIFLAACSGGTPPSMMPATGNGPGVPTTSQVPPSYTMTALPFSHVNAISDNGVIVGGAESADGGGAAEYAHGSLVIFPRHKDSQFNDAVDVNDNGDVVGSDTSGAQQGAVCVISEYLTVFHANGAVTYVGPQPYLHAELHGINNNGIATGIFGANAISYPPLTIVFQPIDAGPRGAVGAAINDSGTIVGLYFVGSNDDNTKPFVTPPQPNCCGTALYGSATDINAHGDIVGESYSTNPNAPTAWFYTNGITTTLALLTDAASSYPRALNDHDEIVGLEIIGPVSNTNLHGVVWINGKVYDLNSLVTNLPKNALIEDAVDINNSGKIVVTVSNAPSMTYLLTPQ